MTSHTMPTTDTIGKWEGECRNRIREGELERQREMQSEACRTPQSPQLFLDREPQRATGGVGRSRIASPARF